ncbi:MAG: FAD-binding oxidoreductase [Syntrophomonadaceae bacterium]|nr:FAD-binding oxidoreductase [Syntrophomonadaceae bacterium]
MSTDYRTSMEGYAEIVREIEVSRKYGVDHRTDRGRWNAAVQRLHPARIELRVSDIIQETERDRTLRLTAAGGYLPPFQAGQYINLLLAVDGVHTSRPYSISSSPRQRAYYDITVRKIDGGWVSTYLHEQVGIGDILYSSGPAGQFHFNPLIHRPELILIAGGSGITPFMSMLREAVDAGLTREFHLIYGCRDEAEMIFAQELKYMALRHDNIAFTPVLSEPDAGRPGATGLITREIIEQAAQGMGDPSYFVCGPEAMNLHVTAILEAMNVPRRRMRREMAGSLGDITRKPGWPPHLSGQQQVNIKIAGQDSIKAACGDSLLSSLEKAGKVMPSLCRSGECSMCRIKLVQGEVFQPPGALIRESDRKFGYIHSCRAYPLSDVEIVL